MIEGKTRLSAKRQITLPVRVTRALGLEPGLDLLVRVADDHIVLIPLPENLTQSLAGSLQGVYGKDVDAYIREERAGWCD